MLGRPMMYLPAYLAIKFMYIAIDLNIQIDSMHLNTGQHLQHSHSTKVHFLRIPTPIYLFVSKILALLFQ